MKGFPAVRLLAVMEYGFSKSLGVNCTHCHDPNNWASEEKLTKQVARDMWDLVGKLNRELLPEIPNLSSPMAVVNCTTCHRGQVIPATSLD
jgi:photosynthetic reaction center cytochrome c subunit